MAYKETILYSQTGLGGNGNITLTASPTAYDRIKVNYAGYNFGASALINTTSWNVIDSKAQPFFCYEFNPNTHNIINLQDTRWGNLTINGAGTLQRSCSQRTGCNTTQWKMKFNVTGTQNSKACTTDGWYNSIESVIGINYNQSNVAPTKKVILYSGQPSQDTSSFTLTESISAYDRIGIISSPTYSSFSVYPTQLPVSRYQEVPSWLLSRNNNFIATCDLLNGVPTGQWLHNIAIYSGCSGQTWNFVSGFRTQEGSNNADSDQRVCRINKIIGIKL